VLAGLLDQSVSRDLMDPQDKMAHQDLKDNLVLMVHKDSLE
jgi:hypothetical protein